MLLEKLYANSLATNICIAVILMLNVINFQRNFVPGWKINT
jgi:hypothetical protein